MDPSAAFRPLSPAGGAMASDARVFARPSLSRVPERASPSQLPAGEVSNPVAFAAASSSCASASQFSVFSEAAAHASELVRQIAAFDETDGSLESKLRALGTWSGGCTYTQAMDPRSYEENRHAFSLGQAFPQILPLPPVLQRLLHRDSRRRDDQTERTALGEEESGRDLRAQAPPASPASGAAPVSSPPSGVLSLLHLLWVADGATLHLWPLPAGTDLSSFSPGFPPAAVESTDARDSDKGRIFASQAGLSRSRRHRMTEQQRLLHSTLTYELPSPLRHLEHVLLPRTLLPPAFAGSFLSFSPSATLEGGRARRAERAGDAYVEVNDGGDSGDEDSGRSAPGSGEVPSDVEATHFHALIAVCEASLAVLALSSPEASLRCCADELSAGGAAARVALLASSSSDLQIFQIAHLSLNARTPSFASAFFASSTCLPEITAVGVHCGSSRVFLGDAEGGMHELLLMPLPSVPSARSDRGGAPARAYGSPEETPRLGVRKMRRRTEQAPARGARRAACRRDPDAADEELEDGAESATFGGDDDESGAETSPDGDDVDAVGLLQCRVEPLRSSIFSRLVKGAADIVTSAFAFLPSRRRPRRREEGVRHRRAVSASPPLRRRDEADTENGGDRIVSITPDEERGALWILTASSDVAVLLLEPPALSPDATLVEAKPDISLIRLKRRELERQIGADFRNWVSPPVPFCGEANCPHCPSPPPRFGLRGPMGGGAPRANLSGNGFFAFFGSRPELRLVSVHPTAPQEAQTIAAVLFDDRGGRVYLQLEHFQLVSRLMGDAPPQPPPGSYGTPAPSAPFLRVAWYRPAPAAAGYCTASSLWASSSRMLREGERGVSQEAPSGAAAGASPRRGDTAVVCGARHRKLKLGFYSQGASVLLFEAADEEGDDRDAKGRAPEPLTSQPAFERLVAVAPDLEASARAVAAPASSYGASTCYASPSQSAAAAHPAHPQASSAFAFSASSAARSVQPLKEAFAAFPLFLASAPSPASSCFPLALGESLWIVEAPLLSRSSAVAQTLSAAAAFALPSPFDVAKRAHWRYLPYRDVLPPVSSPYGAPFAPHGSRGAVPAFSSSHLFPQAPEPSDFAYASAQPQTASSSYAFAAPHPSAAPSPPTNPLFASVEKTIAVAPPPFASPAEALPCRRNGVGGSYAAYGTRGSWQPELAVPLAALPALARDQVLPPRRVLLITSRCVVSLTFCSLEQIYQQVVARLVREAERRLRAPGGSLRKSALLLADAACRRDEDAPKHVTFLPGFQERRQTLDEATAEAERAVVATAVAAVDARARPEGLFAGNSSHELSPVEQRMQKVQNELVARQRQAHAERMAVAERIAFGAGGVYRPYSDDARNGVCTPYGAGEVRDASAGGWTKALFGGGGWGGNGFFSSSSGNSGAAPAGGPSSLKHAGASSRDGVVGLDTLIVAYLRDAYTAEQVAAVCWQLLIDVPSLLSPSLASTSTSSASPLAARDLHLALRSLLAHEQTRRSGAAPLDGTATAGFLYPAPASVAHGGGDALLRAFASRADRAFLDVFLRSTRTLSALPASSSPFAEFGAEAAERAGAEAALNAARGADVAMEEGGLEAFSSTPFRRGYISSAETPGDGDRRRLGNEAREGLAQSAGFYPSPPAAAVGASPELGTPLASCFGPFAPFAPEDGREGRGFAASSLDSQSLAPGEISAFLVLAWQTLVNRVASETGGACAGADQEADTAMLKQLEAELNALRQKNAQSQAKGDGRPGGRPEGATGGATRLWVFGGDSSQPRGAAPGAVSAASLQEQQLELQIKQLQLQMEQRRYQQQMQLSTSAAPSSGSYGSLSPTVKGLLLFVSRLLRPFLFAPLFEATHSPSGILRSPSAAAASFSPAFSASFLANQRKRSRLTAFLFGDDGEGDPSTDAQSVLAVAGLAGLHPALLTPGALPVPICMRGRFSLAAVALIQKKLALLFMVIDAVYTAIFQQHLERPERQMGAQPAQTLFAFALTFPTGPSLPPSLPPHYSLPAFSAFLAGCGARGQATDTEACRDEQRFSKVMKAAAVWCALPSHEQQELQHMFAVSRMLLLCNEALAAYRLLLREMRSCAQLGTRRFIDALQFDRVLCLNLSLLCSERSSREEFRRFVFSCVSVQSPALAQLCTGALFTPQELRGHSALLQLKNFIEDSREALEQSATQQRHTLALVLQQRAQAAAAVPPLPLAPGMPLALPAPSAAVLALQTQVHQFVAAQLLPVLLFFSIGALAELLASAQMFGLLVHVVSARAEDIRTRFRLAAGGCSGGRGRVSSLAEETKELEETCYVHITALLQRFLRLHREATESERGAQGGPVSAGKDSVLKHKAEFADWARSAAADLRRRSLCFPRRLEAPVGVGIEARGTAALAQLSRARWSSPPLSCHVFARADSSVIRGARWRGDQKNRVPREPVFAGSEGPEALFWRAQAATLVAAVLATDDAAMQQFVFHWIAQTGQKSFPQSLLTLQSPHLLPWLQQNFRFFALDLGEFYAAAGLSARAAAEYLSQGLRPWSDSSSSSPLDSSPVSSSSPDSKASGGGSGAEEGGDTMQSAAAQKNTAQLLAFDSERDAFCVDRCAPIWQRCAAYVSARTRPPALQTRLLFLAKAKDALQQQTQEAEARGDVSGGFGAARGLTIGDASYQKDSLASLLSGVVTADQVSESIQMVGYQQGLLRDCLRVFCFLALECAMNTAQERLSLSRGRDGRAGTSPFLQPRERRGASQPEENEVKERLFRESLEEFLRDFFAEREEADARGTFPSPRLTAREREEGAVAADFREEWEVFHNLLDLMTALQKTVYSRSELLALVTFFWGANRRVQDGGFAFFFPSVAALQLLAHTQYTRTASSFAANGLSAAEKRMGGGLFAASEGVGGARRDAEGARFVAAACQSYLAFAIAAVRAFENDKILSTALDDLLSYPDIALRRVQSASLPDYLLLLHAFAREQAAELLGESSASFVAEDSNLELDEVMLNAHCRVGGDACAEARALPLAVWPAWMILHRRVAPGKLVDAYLHLIRIGSPWVTHLTPKALFCFQNHAPSSLAVKLGLTPRVQALVFAWLFDAWLINEDTTTSSLTFIKTFSFYLAQGKLPGFETPNDCLHAQLSREEREGAQEACRSLTALLLKISAALAAAAAEVPQLKQLELCKSACVSLNTFQSKLGLYADALAGQRHD
ncbi:hypothetical protein BESB_002590 [Besnoitia besnoiti]|uniref:Uncharacterized protein n=1 Tax=Besnoitia besnoiti TaxID=94643 RepID=A0A2A9MHB0_BESBE|nr:hypothetical protein BESB_002590 [Besnoitia besnoiti]PFH37918.1 hypothetical protein BESB_002590 [Besnoitia besnoiti]